MTTLAAATLNGLRATSARANIPAWGCWYAEVSLDGEHALSGSATLKIADLTLMGTILSGGAAKGRSTFRIVAGAGGWGRELKAKSYVNDATVKISTVIGDAAREAGETLAPVAASSRTGPAYVREAGHASNVLQTLSPRAWYVDELGVTRLGSRSAGALTGNVTRIAPVDKSRGKLVLAAESVASILPGIVVDGLTAVDVLHEISSATGLRSTLWGAQNPSALDSVEALVRQLDPDRAFRGVTEYRVDTRTGNRLNLQPVRVSSGMPELKLVPVRPGVAGCKATVALASRVLVGFVDSDPSRPFVIAHEDADGDNFLPTDLSLVGGVLGVARQTDAVQAGPFAGTITGGSTKVKAG